MSNTEKMQLTVAQHDKVLFKGEASQVNLPTADGVEGILPKHQATVSLLGEGTVSVLVDKEEKLNHKITWGVVEVQPNNVVTVLVRNGG